ERQTELLEVAGEVLLPGPPASPHAQQLEEIPDLDGVDLHGGRRQEQQTLGPVPQAGLGVRALEQFKQAVGAVLLPVQEVLTAGMVSFIDADQMPRLGLDQLLLPLPPLRQVA